MNQLIATIKSQFRSGSMAIKLIMVNVGFFAFSAIVSIVLKLLNVPVNLSLWYGASSSFIELIFKPWTLVTYMFSHDLMGIGHLFWNMILLYFAGTFFVSKLGSKKLMSVYLAGGFFGYLLFFIGFNFLPAFDQQQGLLIGASAAAIGVFVSIGMSFPDYPLKFTFIAKPIKLWYIVAGVVLLDLIRLQSSIGMENGNAGGWLSHLGGAAFGFIYASKYRQGKNILAGFERFLDSLVSLNFPKIFEKKTKSKLTAKQGGKPSNNHSTNKAKKRSREENEQINAILEKVKKSGYQSLTSKEKEIFFKK